MGFFYNKLSEKGKVTLLEGVRQRVEHCDDLSFTDGAFFDERGRELSEELNWQVSEPNTSDWMQESLLDKLVTHLAFLEKVRELLEEVVRSSSNEVQVLAASEGLKRLALAYASSRHDYLSLQLLMKIREIESK